MITIRVRRSPSTGDSFWAGALGAIAALLLVLALALYLWPGSAAGRADWTEASSAYWQGWLHVAQALASLCLCPLAVLLGQGGPRAVRLLGRLGGGSGSAGLLIYALIMGIQADAWFHASQLALEPDPAREQAVTVALFYSNQILGGLGEALALMLIGFWLCWIAGARRRMPLSLRVPAGAVGVLIITGTGIGYLLMPFVMLSLSVWSLVTARQSSAKRSAHKWNRQDLTNLH